MPPCRVVIVTATPESGDYVFSYWGYPDALDALCLLERLVIGDSATD